jgi:hypothetical protein
MGATPHGLTTALDAWRRREAGRGRAGAVLHLAGQLTAGGIDVVAAGLAHRRHDAGVLQRPREG